MEAAILTCFSFGDEVVVAVLGDFSEQFAKLAEAFRFVSETTKGFVIIHNERATGCIGKV